VTPIDALQNRLVSVVVPTRGRPALLGRCLEALCRQTLERHRYEIVIVDDGPDDQTRSLVEACTARMAAHELLITYVPSSGPHGPAAARNRGWRHARGELIAFTDDDTQPDPDWLFAGLRAFNAESDAVSGLVVMPLPDVPTDYECDASGLAQAEFVTANCFCRKAVLVRLGGFDERFPLAWREDSDLHFRLLRAHARIAYACDAVVVHPIRPAQWGVSLRQQRKIMFDALLFRKHPELYRARIRKSPRWDYYAAVAALALVPLALGFGARDLALAAAAAWAGITGWFCIARLRHTSKEIVHVAEMIVTSALIPPVAVFWRIVGCLRYRTWLA
jgi:glycosyltransferase involved in cell wall biosynthesis